MRIVEDWFGRMVRLNAERLAHILGHPEMQSMEAGIERVLRQPALVRRSRSDGEVRLFYEFYPETIAGGKGSASSRGTIRKMRLS